MLGLEHEYQLYRSGRQTDFRDLIHGLAIRGRRLDPGDTNAYRCDSGLVVTCDEMEAEIATPPVVVGEGFGSAIDEWAAAGRSELTRLLPHDASLRGYSTHLSASFAEGHGPEAAALFCRTFAPAVMMVFDRPDSLGVYLRPRPGRLELCGEYGAGEYLRAAAVLFTGGVRACASALRGEVDAAIDLPPALDVYLRQASGRYGLYVGRRLAFGFDLYNAGRNASLAVAADGRRVRAQDHLAHAAEAALSALGQDVDSRDRAGLDAIVRGDLPLRVESGADSESPSRAAAPQHALGAILETRRRAHYAVEAQVATWDFTLFRIEGRRRAYACVPRDALPAFLARLDGGALDQTIEAYLAAESQGRRLASNESTRESGLWDEVAPGLDLLPAERDPATGRLPGAAASGMRAGKATTGRQGKGGPGGGRGAGTTAGDGDARPGKPARDESRPGKPLLLPPSRNGPPPRPAGQPPLPLPPPADQPDTPPTAPADTAPPAPEPPASLGPGRGLVLIGVAIAAVVGTIVVAAAAAGVFSGGSAPAPITPTATATRTATPTPPTDATPTPAPSLTASPVATVAGAVLTPTPSGPKPTETPPIVVPVATATPQVAPAATATCAVPNAAGGCAPTPTTIPLATVTPTSTCVAGLPGAINACTPTPRPPTSTPTPLPTATPTKPPGTPTPPPCGPVGSACTPTPTRTPGGAAIP